MSLCVCVRGGGACLSERNRAAEQGLSPLVCEAHRVSTGLGVTAAACNWIRDNRTLTCLSPQSWLLSPISRAPLCLLPCLPSTGLCERLYLLASPVPTRCPLGSREARIQERGLLSVQFSSVQFSRSLVSDSVIPWTAARQASLSITNSQSLPKLVFIESVMPSNHLILCHPLLLPSSLFPSVRVFSDVSALHIRWPKYWSFSFNISPSNE